MTDSSILSGSEQSTHEYFMQQALEQAKLAWEHGEVPVGAVLVQDNQIIAKGHNKSITYSDSSLHAEIDVIRQAGQKLSNYRLVDTELYVTLEPCMMCLGAILHSRINKIYYGASDPKTGALGGLVDLTKQYQVNHKVEIIPNILAKPCSEILKEFFRLRR